MKRLGFVGLLGLFLCALPLAAGGYGETNLFNRIELSPDGSALAFAHHEGAAPVRVIDVENGRILFEGPVEGAVTDVRFDPTGTRIAWGETISFEPTAGAVHAVELTTGGSLARIETPAIYWVAFPSHDQLVFHSFDTVMTLNLPAAGGDAGSPIEAAWTDFPLDLFHRQWDYARPMGDLLATKAMNVESVQPLVFKTISDDRVLRTIPLPQDFRAFTLDRDGSRVAFLLGIDNYRIEVRNTADWSVTETIIPTSATGAMAFAPDGDVLYVELHSGIIQAFSLPAGTELGDPLVILSPVEQLFDGVRFKDDELVTGALAAGADPSALHPSSGISILHSAVYYRNNWALKLLTDLGADPNRIAVMPFEGYRKTTPLLAALVLGHHTTNFATLQLLLDAGADPNQAPLSAPLAFANRYGPDSTAAQFLVQHGARQDAQWWGPLENKREIWGRLNSQPAASPEERSVATEYFGEKPGLAVRYGGQLWAAPSYGNLHVFDTSGAVVEIYALLYPAEEVRFGPEGIFVRFRDQLQIFEYKN